MRFDLAALRAKIKAAAALVLAVLAWPFIALLGRSRAQSAWAWLREPLEAVAIVFVFASAVAQPFYVPSGSMQPTLGIGDAVLATKFSYGYSWFSIPYVNVPSGTQRLLGSLPKAGDVVVFRLPTDIKINYVKRVIGLPGDHIQMHAGRLWINGKELPLRDAGTGEVEYGPGSNISGVTREVPKYIETLPNGVEHPIYKWQWNGPLDNTEEFVVPAGHVFMMGDNRDDSTDSRAELIDGGFGHYVPLGNLAGRAFVVIGSVDYLNADTIFGWIGQFRASRVLKRVR
jgi:signal peptidase I